MRACSRVPGYAWVGVDDLVALTRCASHAFAGCDPLHSGLTRRLTRRGALALPGPGLAAALSGTGGTAALTSVRRGGVHGADEWLTRV